MNSPHITFRLEGDMCIVDIEGGTDFEITDSNFKLLWEFLLNQVEFSKKQERERIIALLEADIAKCDWKEVAKDVLSDEPCEECDQTRHLIALIKGEN